MATAFKIEKRYYRADECNAPRLTDDWVVIFPTLDEAKALYHNSTDPWFFDGEDLSFAISEIEWDGLEVGYHPLPPRIECAAADQVAA